MAQHGFSSNLNNNPENDVSDGESSFLSEEEVRFVGEEEGFVGTEEDILMGEEEHAVGDEENAMGEEGCFPGKYYTLRGRKSMYDLTREDIIAMTFESHEEGYNFYHEYGLCRGFGVRLNEIKKNKAGQTIYRTVLCSSAGFRNSKDSSEYVRPRTDDTRTGCAACIKFGLNTAKGLWEVRHFEENHNHPLMKPTEVYLHRSFREITEADKVQCTILQQLGVSPRQIMNVLAQQKGGHGRVGFLKKDLYNVSAAVRSEFFKDGDAQRALGYLDAKKIIEPGSFEAHTLDDNGRLVNLFWADAGAIMDYQFFGDVVSFDATYKTNCYEHPLVVFVGANNHEQTCFFGAALLAKEDEESYVWLLKAFLKCHVSKQPIGVITDSCKAMRKAIKVVFPESRHRLCSWHLGENCDNRFKDASFTLRYKKIMFKSCTEEEFEESWVELLRSKNIGADNGWAKENYRKRKLWARAFLSGSFFAGMTSTQRSEGINSFIKLITNPNMKMFELVNEFDTHLNVWRQKEFAAEYKTRHHTPAPQTTLTEIETHGRNVYTRAVFRRFLREVLKHDQKYFVEPNGVVQLGQITYHTVRMSGLRDHSWTVHFDKPHNLIKCSCKRFEEDGLPCSHIICVMKVEHLQNIPTCCILRRWTRDAMTDRDRPMCDPSSSVGAKSMRFAAAMSMANSVCQEASQDPDSFDIFRDKITQLRSHIIENRATMAGNSSSGSHDSCARGESEKVLDPLVSRANGKQTRKCSNCNEPGHRITKCPKIRSNDPIAGEREDGHVDLSSDHHINSSLLDNSQLNPYNHLPNQYQGPAYFHLGEPSVYYPSHPRPYWNSTMGGSSVGHMQPNNVFPYPMSQYAVLHPPFPFYMPH